MKHVFKVLVVALLLVSVPSMAFAKAMVGQSLYEQAQEQVPQVQYADDAMPQSDIPHGDYEMSAYMSNIEMVVIFAGACALIYAMWRCNN